MITTPEQQKAAAEAARKEGEVKTEESKKPAPAPEPMAGSPSKLQTPTQPTAPSK